MRINGQFERVLKIKIYWWECLIRAASSSKKILAYNTTGREKKKQLAESNHELMVTHDCNIYHDEFVIEECLYNKHIEVIEAMMIVT